jgi:hypothetical protein
MPGYKVANGKAKPKNWKRAINGVEIKPTLFYYSSGRRVMGGSVNGEIVMDETGKNPVPFKAIKHTELL